MRRLCLFESGKRSPGKDYKHNNIGLWALGIVLFRSVGMVFFSLGNDKLLFKLYRIFQIIT